MTLFKVSLHSHTSDFAHLIGTKPAKEKYFLELLKILFKKCSAKETLVLGITNFNDDNRYTNLFMASRNLPKDYRIDSRFYEYFFSVSKEERKIYFIKTDEIATDKGHILIVGHPGKVRHRKLREILKKAHEEKCIIIASHPLHEFGIPYFIFNRLSGNKNTISLDMKDIKNYEKDFDALELNAYFPEDWSKIRKIGEKDKINIVSDSDSHFLDELFVSFYETEHLSFSSPISFKKSLKKALKRGIKLHARKLGLTAEYRHGLQVFLETLGLKLGFIKK